MIRPARLAASLLPLVGLAVLWGWSDYRSRQGTEWEVPIQGYDPRDFLRGHYVEFAYDWPGLEENAFIGPEALCLEGVAPQLDRVTLPAKGAGPCAHPLVAEEGGVYGVGALSRGRLYVGQNRAAALEEELRNRDQRGMVTIRQREDGSFTPVAIRFRPITAAETAARDAAFETIEPTAPPIMEQ
jgi:hypothetical protein